MFRIVVAGVSATLIAVAAFAQPASPDPEARGVSAAKSVRDVVLRMVPAGPVADRYSLYPFAALVGREDLTVFEMQSASPCAGPQGDPIAAIVEGARKTSIVIINEDHGSPHHRAFVAQVLKALKPEGYTIYAAEAFSSLDLKSPDVSSNLGYYTQEPIFGRTVRTAKALGYELVAYENETAGAEAEDAMVRANRREEVQKDNLMAAIFKARPKAKVVIHVGGSHMLERPIAGQMNLLWMAGRLKTATGIDPFTVSQTACLSSTGAAVAATARQTREGLESAEAQAVDLFVGHPKMVYRDHRPVWRREAEDHEAAIPPVWLGDKLVIVEARPEGMSLGSVPVDRILARPGETMPLLLPPGRYRLDGYDAAGPVATSPAVIEVKP